MVDPSEGRRGPRRHIRVRATDRRAQGIHAHFHAVPRRQRARPRAVPRVRHRRFSPFSADAVSFWNLATFLFPSRYQSRRAALRDGRLRQRLPNGVGGRPKHPASVRLGDAKQLELPLDGLAGRGRAVRVPALGSSRAFGPPSRLRPELQVLFPAQVAFAAGASLFDLHPLNPLPPESAGGRGRKYRSRPGSYFVRTTFSVCTYRSQ